MNNTQAHALLDTSLHALNDTITELGHASTIIDLYYNDIQSNLTAMLNTQDIIHADGSVYNTTFIQIELGILDYYGYRPHVTDTDPEHQLSSVIDMFLMTECYLFAALGICVWMFIVFLVVKKYPRDWYDYLPIAYRFTVGALLGMLSVFRANQTMSVNFLQSWMPVPSACLGLALLVFLDKITRFIAVHFGKRDPKQVGEGYVPWTISPVPARWLQ